MIIALQWKHVYITKTISEMKWEQRNQPNPSSTNALIKILGQPLGQT